MLMSLLVAVIIFGLLVYVVQLLPLPAPFGTIALVILVIIFLLYLLQFVPHSGWRGFY